MAASFSASFHGPGTAFIFISVLQKRNLELSLSKWIFVPMGMALFCFPLLSLCEYVNICKCIQRLGFTLFVSPSHV